MRSENSNNHNMVHSKAKPVPNGRIKWQDIVTACFGISGAAVAAGATLFFVAMEWLFLVPVLALAVILFVIFDGYKFGYIFVKTLPRDLKGASRYLRLLIHIRICQWKNLTVPKIFERNAARHPHKVCFYFEDQKWTFQNINEYSNRIANFFQRRGLRKGDAVALFMENRPEYVATWIGLAKIGVTPALINFNLRLQPLVHSINIVDSKAVIFGHELSEAMIDISATLSADIPLFSSGGGAGSTMPLLKAENLDTFLTTSDTTKPAELEPVNYCDKLVYIYTSGTTGLPKAAVITNSRYMLMVGLYFVIPLRQSDIIYAPLPLYHGSGGGLGTGPCICYGLSAVLRKKFSAVNYFSDVIKYECTVAQYIGEICRYLLSTQPHADDKRHKIRVMYGNGLRPQIWEQFTKRFNIPNICEFYGATEGNANIVNLDNTVGAVGFISRIMPFVYPVTLIKLDEVTTEPLRDKNGICIRCKPGETGEFIGRIIRNHPIRDFHGYADKAATQKKVVSDVWKKGDLGFRSGDMLYMDELGYFFFVDRTGDTFRWKGENVSTSEVEGIVSNVAGLKDAVSYGVEVAGMEGKAGMATIHDPEGNLELKAFSEGIVKTLPSYARPLFIRIVKELDVTGTYKLKKLDLQSEGYNVETIKDNMYFYDSKTSLYVPLTKDLHESIITGKTRV